MHAAKSNATQRADLVVAVDDAGDFNASSTIPHFYVAAMVRAGKEEQFRRWEAGIPARGRKHGEVKGGYLTDDQLHDFVREVLASAPRILVTRVAADPGKHVPGDISGHRAETVALNRAASARLSAGGNSTLAAEAARLAGWLDRAKDAQYLKLAVQTECVARSLANTVGHAISGRFDRELPSLRYKIDQGLADKAKDRQLWKRMVQFQVRRLDQQEGHQVVSLDTWERTGHPFLDLYRLPGGWNFDPLFEGRCAFLPSKDHFEICIADIVASVHRSYFAHGRCKVVYERMMRSGVFAHRGEWFTLRLAPQRQRAGQTAPA